MLVWKIIRNCKMITRITATLAKKFINVSLGHIAVFTIIYSLTTLMSCIIAQSQRKRWKRRRASRKQNRLALKIAYLPKVFLFKQKHNPQVIPDLKTPRWIKIGEVANLYIYPLISGKAYAVDECHVMLEEMKMFKRGKLIKWDRSFVVYDVDYNYIITTGNFPELNEVCVSIKKNSIILETAGMPTLYVKLSDKKTVECSFWNNGKSQTLAKITCIDCGDEAARWLSSFLCGKNIGLRLGYSINIALNMKIYWQHWLRNCILYQNAKSHMYSLNPFVNVLHSVVISSETYNKMSTKLNVYKPNEMICPNIIISASNLYEKEIWEWIKIGNVIIRNTQPLVVWPRKVIDSEDMRLFGLGVNCKVYISGRVKLDDDVYIHIPKCKEETGDIEKV